MIKTKPITTEKVEATKFYRSLNPILKKITSKHGNIKVIEHGFNVATNIGFEKWDQQQKPRYVHKMIVKELVEAD